MRTYKPICGEVITTTVRKIVDMANRYNETVETSFNGIILHAEPGDTDDKIISYFQTEIQHGVKNEIRLHCKVLGFCRWPFIKSS